MFNLTRKQKVFGRRVRLLHCLLQNFLLLLVALFFPINLSLATPVKHKKIDKPPHTYKKNVAARRIIVKKKQSRNQSKTNIVIKHNVQKIQTPIQNITYKSTNQSYSSTDKRLVRFVHNMMANMRYSSYKLGGTHFDTTRGVYIIDCSNYVDRILKATYPLAYSRLVNWSGSAKPTTHDYYHFFTKLSARSKHYWDTIEDVKKLRAGDILVFRKKNMPRQTTGHIMIVMDKPIRNKNMFLLRIADSAPFRHSQDTRRFRVSGVGIGTMLLKVNPKTSQPSAYAWSVGSSWKKNVVFAMARPLDINSS